ncbi:MAG TPA: hypothetical protein DEA08_18680 [Planctomycetes bacterium]|nr:hypothetical protein [Planctomycetota bacterium]
MADRDHDKKPVRLEAQPQRASRLRVDRSYPGRISGISLITTGPAEGHGFEVDARTVDQVTEHAEGLRGRWTHGDLSSDGLGRHLGRWENVRPEPFWLCRACGVEAEGAVCRACHQPVSTEWRAVGDFAFDRSAYKIRPDGLDVPAPVYLMDRAEEDPRSLGISVVARFDFEEEPAFEGDEPARLARIAARGDLLRGDWVADPAANPVGLHAGTHTPSELTEGAVDALDRIVARVGKEQAKTRALAFLARYFGDSFGEEVPAEAAEHGSPKSASGALRARVDALEEELRDLRLRQRVEHGGQGQRGDARVDVYLRNLQARATALNAPIPAADLAKVRRLLEEGDLDAAKTVAAAFLDRSRAARQSPFLRGGVFSLDQQRDPAHAKESVAAQRRMLRKRGWKVEVSPDGTAIQDAAPRRGGDA